MKTKFKHFGNSAIALVLSAIMLLSSSIVGSSSTIDTKAIEAVTESPAAVEETTPTETVTEDALTEETAPENGSVFVDNEEVSTTSKKSLPLSKASSGKKDFTIFFSSNGLLRSNNHEWYRTKYIYMSGDVNDAIGTWSNRPSMDSIGNKLYSYSGEIDENTNNYEIIITDGPNDDRRTFNFNYSTDNGKCFVLNASTGNAGSYVDIRDLWTWYIVGVFSKGNDSINDWNNPTTFSFTKDATQTNKYYFETDQTLAELHSNWFRLKNYANNGWFANAYNGSSSGDALFTESVTTYSLVSNANNAFNFDTASSTDTKKVKLWLDISNPTSPSLSYTLGNDTTQYDITIDNFQNGTVSATVEDETASKATVGDTVQVTASKEGYTPIITVTNSTANTQISKTVGGSTSFTMPAGNVTISAAFVETTDLTITPTVPQVGGADPGTVSPASATVTVGETATFTATENSGYGFTSWTIGGTEGTDYILVSGTDGLELEYYPLTANATVQANFVVDNNVRIYFYRCDQWADVPYVRYTTDTGTNKWDTSGAVAPFAMTLVDSSRNLYTARVPAGSTIYFQNGSEPGSASINYSVNNLTAQANYAYASNDWYSNNRNSVNVQCSSAPYEITIDSSKTYIVYSTEAPYGGSYGWVPTYAYMWNSNDSSTNNTFPGVLLSKVSGFDNLYAAELTITYSNYDMLVFHDGSGVGDEDGNGYDYSAHKSMDLSFSYSNDVLSSSKDVVWYPQNTKCNVGDNKFRQFGKTTYAQLTGIDTNEPEVTSTTVPVYAKSGTVRDQGSSSTAQYNKYSELADTTIYTDGHENDANKGFDYYKKDWWGYDSSINGGGNRVTLAHAEKGTKINIKTTIKSSFKTKYYVKAFCINGESYNIIDESQADQTNGIYTCVYYVPDDVKAVEITPIYYYIEGSNSSNYIKFSVEDFAGNVKSKWGNTIACYAWYENGDNGATAANETSQQALGGYPGQPMLHEGGSYYMQLPKSTTELGKIKGITLNNYVWDDVHGYYLRTYSDFNGLNNTGDSSFNDVTNRKKANAQTYDYDDFAALKELSDVDEIIFSFKYRTFDNHDAEYGENYDGDGNKPQANDILATDAASRFGASANKWNVLVDYDDHPVDLFGNDLSETYENDTAVFNAANANKLFVVSDGYINYYTDSTVSADNIHDSYLGEYATKWYVYSFDGSTYTYKGALPPSAFITTSTLAAYDSLSESDTTAQAEFAKYLDSGVHSAVVNKLFATYVSLFNSYKGVPVEITYESALNSNGRYNANTSNWGYRNDGRWYYSRKSTTTIYADTKIYILQDSSATGDNIYEYEGTKYLLDEYLTEKNKGSITGAVACFDDSELGLDHSGKTSLTNVTKNSSDYFQLKADSVSTVTESGKTYNYVFKGWFLDTGGDVLNPITENTKTYRQMSSFAHFVAVYSKEEVDSSKMRTLQVDHNLYKEQTLDSSDPAAHTGTGSTYVESIIITDEDNKVLKKATGNEVDSLSIDLLSVSGAKNVIVNLRTQPDSESELTQIYEYNESGTPSKYTEKGITGAVTVTTGKTISYTYNYETLFGTGTNVKPFVQIKLYSDLKPTATTYDIPLEFNFYDRNVVNNQTASIKSTATTLHYTLTNITNYASLKSKLGSFVGETSEEGITFIGDLTNVIDEYYIWSSQTQAIDATAGLGDRVYYKDDTFTNGTHSNGSVEKYKNHGDYNSKSPYHTNYLGALQNGTEGDGQKWVTYYDSNSQPITISGSTTTENGKTVYNDNVDPASVKKIVLWAFNEPKQYTLTVCTDKKVVPTGSPEGTEAAYHGTVKTAGQDEMYFFGDEGSISYADGTAKAPTFTGFYNQRVGVADTYGASDNGSDGAVTYLKNYFGRADNDVADIAYTGQVVEAPQTAEGPEYDTGEKDTNGNSIMATTYYFDGWYIKAHNGKYVKVSSDRIYGNRITSKLTLYPMYKKTNSYANGASSIGGSTATNNGKDVYIDDSNTKNVRLNTQLNVYYNGATKDNDDKIKQVSVIYVNLTDNEAENAQTIRAAGEKAKTWINANKGFLTQTTGSSAKVRKSGSVKLNQNDTVNHVVIMDTYQNTKSASGDLQITLTSKNRIQFVLPMSSNLYDETYNNIIAFVAIQYDNGTETTWYVSDNYVSYIPGTFEDGED